MSLNRRLGVSCILVACLTLVTVRGNQGGQHNGRDGAQRETVVPGVIKVSGQLLDAAGQPLKGPVSALFGVYGEQDARTPVWTETQIIDLDTSGRYTVQLGASTPGGIPSGLFVGGEARWLGVQAAETVETRTALISVPYALKAADAETLGGKPASEYVTVSSTRPDGSVSAAATTTTTKSLKGVGTTNSISKFLDFETLGDSVLFETGGLVGIGTTAPAFRLDVAGTIRGTGATLGISGIATAASGAADGVSGTTSSFNGAGVAGNGPGFGVRGTSANAGVYGLGTSIGVIGSSQSGVAVRAQGGSLGVHATVSGVNAVAGLFENNEGTILEGRSNAVRRFIVDGSGNVQANAYLDLSGTPIPNGDITAVSAGNGLIGGGSAGDVTLTLDTSFTSGLYASKVHLHNVVDVSNAATLAANTFVGDQTITGNASISGQLNLGSLRVVSGTNCCPIFGEATTTAPAMGVTGRTASTNGGAAGVYGVATASSGAGSVHGVLGETLGSVGGAVRGLARHQFGIGVEAFTEGTGGTALLAQTLANSGNTTAILAVASSPTGTVAKLQSAGGDLIVGQQGGLKFRVDGTGAVYASSYRDLAGNPIPTGTGDITGVSAGEGLTGGGTSGELAVALDTGFTNNLYAAKVHGHAVGEVTDAARLTGGNSLSGNQSITGSLSATGNIGALTGVFDGGLTGVGGTGRPNLTGVRGETNSTAAEGVLGVNISPGGRAVRGHATATSGIGLQGFADGTGDTRGVQGIVSSPGGMGVQGLANAGSGPAFGVYGSSTSPAGTGVRGHAGPSTGATLGVHGTANSDSGTGVKGEAAHGSGSTVGVLGVAASPAGVAGLFDAQGGGNILVGRATSAEKFRVDGTGAVYASSYRDLAGNPIPTGTGDITSVNVGPGLTGGGTSSDVSLALDTTFTDSRYAPGIHGHDVAQVTNAARLTANNFSGNQTISGGNLDLNQSTATAGMISKDGTRFIHDYRGTFVGFNAGNFTTTTMVGGNTGVGAAVLFNNTTGNNNTAVGDTALTRNTTGFQNTGLGLQSLSNNEIGSNNVALGVAAGSNATGSNNIYLGAFVQGTAGEFNTMYLGKVGTQTKTVIAGIRGTTVSGGEMVVVDASGRLGSAPTPNAAGVSGWQRVSVEWTLPTAGETLAAYASCPAGKKPMGGGWFGPESDQVVITRDEPDDAAYNVIVRNRSAAPGTSIRVTVICATVL